MSGKMSHAARAKADAATFGRRLRQLRASLGLTQQALAERMGYGSNQTISALENGVCWINIATVVALCRLAAASGFSADWLFGCVDARPAQAPRSVEDRLARIEAKLGIGAAGS